MSNLDLHASADTYTSVLYRSNILVPALVNVLHNRRLDKHQNAYLEMHTDNIKKKLKKETTPKNIVNENTT